MRPDVFVGFLHTHRLRGGGRPYVKFFLAFVFLAVWNSPTVITNSIGALTFTDVLFLIIISLTSGFISLLLYYRGLSTTKASVATIAELGFPFLAVIINAAALGFFLKPMQVAGMALLLLAVWRLSGLSAHESVEAA